MKTGQLLSLLVLASLSGLFFPALVSYADPATSIYSLGNPNVINGGFGLQPSVTGLTALAPDLGVAAGIPFGEGASVIANAYASDFMCTPVIYSTCGCGFFFDGEECVPGNKFMCPCWDMTFGFKTSGVCVAENICLGLGTIGITGAAIGIGKGVVGKILGGSESSGTGVPTGGIPLTGGSKVGCSGTPYISLTPSTDSCAVYIPTGATASSTLKLGNTSSNPSVGSVLLNTANNGSGTAGNQTGVSNTLLSTIGATGGGTSQASIGGQLLNNTTSGRVGTAAGNANNSLSFLNSQGQGVASSLGTGANNSFLSSQGQGVASAIGNAQDKSLGAGTSNPSFLSTVGNSIWNTFFGGGTSVSSAGTGLQSMTSGNSNNTSQSGVSSFLSNYGENTGSMSNNSANVPNIPPKPSGVQAGTWGDIQANASGVTITAGGHDTDGRTGITGFYGYNAVPGIQPQDLAKQLCAARPWGPSSATAIIPPSFFDSVCTARGYNTSASVPATTAGTGARTAKSKNSDVAHPTTSATKTSGTTSAGVKTSLPAGPVYVAPRPSIIISASPARVRIGARSTIYWSARGVTSCTLSSPDGSFTGNTLSGAASTVALYGNTQFTIVCWTEDGSSVSKSVTVQTSS